ncbi:MULTISPECIES: hypothetical protein [unclassified Microcoleus]|uniref:hypothetical protein n=1 Tax=unclassified Microcoleus TaxID=2642155 RepID=UPI002FD27C08
MSFNEGRGKKEEGRRKKEEGRRKKEDFFPSPPLPISHSPSLSPPLPLSPVAIVRILPINYQPGSPGRIFRGD